MSIVDTILKDCDAADRKTFRKYFACLEYAKDLACKPATMEHGWRNGVWPPSPRRVMEMCKGPWENLTPEQQNSVIEGIRLVAYQILSRDSLPSTDEASTEKYDTGVADDHYMESLFGHIFGPILTGPSQEEQGGKRKSTDKVINQWRATRLFHPDVRMLHRNRAMAKETAAAAATAAAEAKAAYALTAAGIKEAEDKEKKKEIAALKKETKRIFQSNNPGVKYIAPKAPPRPRRVKSLVTINCSYCGADFTPSTDSALWKRCDSISHDSCKHIRCGQSACLRLHDNHINE
jgi:hypothetical protein